MRKLAITIDIVIVNLVLTIVTAILSWIMMLLLKMNSQQYALCIVVALVTFAGLSMSDNTQPLYRRISFFVWPVILFFGFALYFNM